MIRYLVFLCIVGFVISGCQTGSVPTSNESSDVQKPTTSTQSDKNLHSAMNTPADLAQNLFKNYQNYHIEALNKKNIKYADIEPHLAQIAKSSIIEVKKIGESVQHRNINLVKLGTGPTKILLWSQMHGDESTATRALFEIFSFFTASDSLDKFKEKILKETTIYAIPMLNPDGAEVYQRRNALSIDLNRDALRLTSPEARILKTIRDQYKPEFGFNLHDQSSYYNVNKTPKTASISFLAPAYNYEKEVNEGRGNAMKLIVSMNRMIQQFIPGQVGRYDDEFEPRAFGDNIQKWGTNTILIESGGYKNDPEKLELVKINFMAILYGLSKIANKAYHNEKIEDYYKIPENDRKLFDLLIRNGKVMKEGALHLMDIGIFTEVKESPESKGVNIRSYIDDFGDLSTFYGYEEIDASGCHISPGKIWPDTLESIDELTDKKIKELLMDGFSTVKMKQLPDDATKSAIDIHLVSIDTQELPDPELGSQIPLLISKNGQVRYAIINGKIKNVSQ